MTRLVDRLGLTAGTQERSWLPASYGWLDQFTYNGHVYLTQNTSWGPKEEIHDFGAASALASNGVAYGIFRRRVDLFAQGKFRFRRFGNPRPTMADSFSTGALARLDGARWLLEQCELGVARAGAAFFVDDGPDLRSLPAEHCTIVCGSNRHPKDPAVAWDAKPTGLIYHPASSGLDPEAWTWDEVYPYIPETDPEARWRGISWLRPAMEDIQSDNGARRYLSRYFVNHATPNTVVAFPADTAIEKIEAYKKVFLAKHAGTQNAFKTAFLGGGADLKVIGASLKDLDSEKVRQQVHKDIASAAGVPIVAAGIEQGTYANSKESNRALADGKLRYLWAVAAETFARAIAVPSGSELYVETAHIAALQADALDDAQVQFVQSQTMRMLGDGGWEKTSVVEGVTKGDLSKIVDTGLVPVQLLPPGTTGEPEPKPKEPTVAETNGADNG